MNSESNASRNAVVVLAIAAIALSLSNVVQLRDQRRQMEASFVALSARILATATVPTSTATATSATHPPTTGSIVIVPSGWKQTTYNDVQLSYPTTWFATIYEDEFVGGQKNLRIASEKGELRIDTRVPSKVISFDTGYQLVVRELDAQQYIGMITELTVNPQILRIASTCDGEASCPYGQYLFEKNGKRYLFEVFNRLPQEGAGIVITDQILASIQ